LSRFTPRAAHVSLHRLWMFATQEGELAMDEHIHILDCDGCKTTLKTCLHAESFAAALKELKPEDDGSTGDNDSPSVGALPE
jgi:hypothetical protein